MADNYHPDLWGQVEGSWRTAPPPQNVIDQAMDTQCPDCNVNVFIEEHPQVDGQYQFIVAHDDTCPWLKKKEESP